LKKLKITIEKQIPFATSSNLELFNAFKQEKVENQNSSIANKKLTDTVACLEMALQEKDQQIQENERQTVQKKDQKLEELHEVRNVSAMVNIT